MAYQLTTLYLIVFDLILLGFLVEGVLGIMPAGYAIADGITHITAAFLCMKAAILVRTGTAKHGELWTANLFGLTDIAVVAAEQSVAFFVLGSATSRDDCFESKSILIVLSQPCADTCLSARGW